MRRSGRMHNAPGLLVLAFVISGCAGSGTLERVAMPTNSPTPFVAGYHVYWAEEAWTEYPFDILDELYFFELEADADGGFLDRHGWSTRWREMTTQARAAGVQVTPTVSMHDADAFRTLFPDAERVERLVQNVVGLLDASPDVAGIHLDFEVFETVEPDVRDGFTAFVVALAAEMRARHPTKALSVFAMAFDDDDVYNERVLGRVADYLVVQGYDYHSAGSSNAGPVAGLAGWGRLNWDTVLDRFRVFGVPAGKIVMSVPLYGYEWPVESDALGATTRGVGVTIPYAAPREMVGGAPSARDEAARHGAERDEQSRSPWYRYLASDGWRQGWYDDAESLREKYDFARSRGLGGIALFPLAYGDPDIWEGLRATFAR